MKKAYPDDDYHNADWPKRTPDTFEALGIKPRKLKPGKRLTREEYYRQLLEEGQRPPS